MTNTKITETKIFLDLEMTLIYDWFEDRSIIDNNIKIIRDFADEYKHIEKFYLFSMAIWSREDVEKFDNSRLKKELELSLGKELECIYMEDIYKKILKNNNILINVYFSDIFMFEPKTNFFIEWIRDTNQKGEFILFDDTVEDSEYIFKDRNFIFIKM